VRLKSYPEYRDSSIPWLGAMSRTEFENDAGLTLLRQHPYSAHVEKPEILRRRLFDFLETHSEGET
jgi:hypothetical protein